MIRNKTYRKAVALFLVLTMIFQILVPTVSYALTSGPSQPEFSSFEPVATTNMVNTFTGDFTYNLPILEVPGPHGSSYPLSLSYHSGVMAEEEASWVGYGWTLNPGAINRNTRGFPDDVVGDLVQHNTMPKNWTATLGAGVAGEIFGGDKLAQLNASGSIRYNNYQGFGYNAGIGIQLGKGVVNLGYNVNNGDGSFSLKVNPFAVTNYFKKKQEQEAETTEQKTTSSEVTVQNRILSTSINNVMSTQLQLVSSNYGLFSFGGGSRPNTVSAYTGESYNISTSLQADIAPFPAGATLNVFGSYSWQRNLGSQSNAVGFMYSDLATVDDLMDYQTEKESNFNKRNTFLGVPFNNADVFMSTGEGIVGGFRMYHKSLGTFGPKAVTSDVDIFNIATAEVHVGSDVGTGVDLGTGFQELSIGDWYRAGQFSSLNASDVDEPVFFRFNNDQGGNWGDEIISDKAENTNPSDTPTPGFRQDVNGNERSGRSTYIGFNTNEQMVQTSMGYNYKAYSKRADLLSSNLREDPKAIGEFSITNESGSNYIYALPVRSRNEANLSHGVRGATPDKIEGNYIVKYKNSEVKIGTEQSAPYAKSYLLTEIITPDYLDRTLNGPTKDDFGGYTKFDYERHFGDGNWYKWRTPYNGLYYQQNSLSDKRDDLGSVSYGEKEVYYLKSVETKTHIAVFQTSQREDAYGAVENDEMAIMGASSNAQWLKKLDAVYLYSREQLVDTNKEAPYSLVDFAGAQPIKSVIFSYAAGTGQQLMNGAPNASNGKLTLSEVQFEYSGIRRLSPYKFSYEYPTVNYPSPYGALDNFGTDPPKNPGYDENPDYSVHNADAWGNYQPNGSDQHDELKTWLDQIKAPNIDYDPAAWHLKAIKLPSGGEIHVQYESDDYAYVQDQRAHVMAPLIDAETDGSVTSFRLDHTKVGIDSPERFAELISDRYIATDKKIFFKFLYALKGNDSPDRLTCNVEYITGYADVAQVEVDAGFVKITLANINTPIPGQVCEEFVNRQRVGMLNEDNCGVDALNDGTNPQDVVLQLLNFLGASLNPSILCRTIDPKLSYFRVPVVQSKRGGGIRVKRLLTFDNTLEQVVLYGNEYEYKTLDENGGVISSGVATNEPQLMREENILVDYIPRKGQSKINKLVYGEDQEQSEGPVGESILPAPSVGYSKVITSNIHRGVTAPGYSVDEFYTAKDYPVKVDMTHINDSRQRNEIKINGFNNKLVNHQYATQGFSFILNNMHGQLKRSATYTGIYQDVPAQVNATVTTEQVYDYFDPGEKVSVMNAAFGTVQDKNIGREVDISIAQKAVNETMFDMNVEFDGTLGIYVLFVIPFVTFWPFQANTDGKLYTHTNSKVIRYPAVQKSVTTFQDGIYHTSENVAFDEYTGQPIAVRSFDEFSGVYLNKSVAASWQYPNFMTKSSNERFKLSSDEGLSILASTPFVGGSGPVDGSLLFLTFEGEASCSAFASFSEGDLVDLGSSRIYHIRRIDLAKDRLVLWKSAMSSSSVLGGSIDTIEVLKSGRNNQLRTHVEEYTFHDENNSLLTMSSLDYSGTNRWTYAGNSGEDGSLLLKDLNWAIDNEVVGTEGNFILNGVYNNMNMSQYPLPECGLNPYKAQVTEVSFNYYVEDGGVKLVLQQFKVWCNDSGSYLIVQ